MIPIVSKLVSGYVTSQHYRFQRAVTKSALLIESLFRFLGISFCDCPLNQIRYCLVELGSIL